MSDNYYRMVNEGGGDEGGGDEGGGDDGDEKLEPEQQDLADLFNFEFNRFNNPALVSKDDSEWK